MPDACVAMDAAVASTCFAYYRAVSIVHACLGFLSSGRSALHLAITMQAVAESVKPGGCGSQEGHGACSTLPSHLCKRAAHAAFWACESQDFASKFKHPVKFNGFGLSRQKYRVSSNR